MGVLNSNQALKAPEDCRAMKALQEKKGKKVRLAMMEILATRAPRVKQESGDFQGKKEHMESPVIKGLKERKENEVRMVIQALSAQMALTVLLGNQGKLVRMER